MKKFLLISLLFLIALPALAIPQKIYLQGILKDANDNKLDGTYSIVFKIYDVATGGTALWQETQSNVQVDKGLYTVVLGSNTAFSQNLFANDPLYVGIQVGSDPEMTPRIQILSVPYALNSDLLDGMDSSQFATTANIGISTADADARYVNVVGDEMTGTLTNSANVKANQFISTVGTGTSPLVVSSSTLCMDLNADMLDGHHASDFTLTTGNYVLFGPNQQQSTTEPFAVWVKSSAVYGVGISSEASGFGGIGVYGLASTYGVYGKVGNNYGYIGSSNTGVYGTGSTYGILGVGGIGAAVRGEQSAGDPRGELGTPLYGVYGRYSSQIWGSIGDSQNGVFGRTNNSSGAGGYFRSTAVSGKAVHGYTDGSGVSSGGYFISTSPSGVGVHGVATDTSVTSANFGGSFEAHGREGKGVYGVCTDPSGGGVGGAFISEGVSGKGVSSTANGTSGIGVLGYAGSVTGTTFGGYFLTASSTGYGAYGGTTSTSGTNYGGYFKSNSSDGYGVYGLANRTTGSNYGVYGKTNSSNGYGVHGQSSLANCYGFLGGKDGTLDCGAYGQYDDNNFGRIGVYNCGVYGSSNSDYGGSFGTYSVTGQGCRGVQNNSGAGMGYGGFFEASSTIGRGVYGRNINTGAYTNYGGYFEARGTTGRGVYGYGQASSGVNCGVYGRTNSSSGYGVYSEGDLHVAGTLSKTSGSFIIDHPLDPENKVLRHSFVESPEMRNIYNGTTVLDKNGEAIVKLPSYSEALNRNFTYQLTTIGDYAPVYVKEKIRDNKFKIAGGKPGMEISWMVTGVRQDAYALNHPIIVEEVKDNKRFMRGAYLNPKDFGKDEIYANKYLLNPEDRKTIINKKGYFYAHKSLIEISRIGNNIFIKGEIPVSKSGKIKVILDKDLAKYISDTDYTVCLSDASESKAKFKIVEKTTKYFVAEFDLEKEFKIEEFINLNWKMAVKTDNAFELANDKDLKISMAK